MQEDQTSPNPNPVVTPPTPPPASRRQISIPNFNLWQGLTVILLIIVIVMVFMWKPWQPNIKASERTISVTGNATVSATPDEYVFSPSYSFTDASKQTALNDLTDTSNQITSKLKSLGVPDSGIKTDSNGYGNDTYYPSSVANGKTTYTLYLTVTVDGSKLAQKVQDYLLTTDPTGSVSPYVSFSKAKQQQVQDQARSTAEANAHTQAEQSAKNLGFKVDAVKSVTDGDLGGINPYNDIIAGANSANSAQSATPHLNLQPGQNDLSYSVKVVYYIH